MMWDQRNLASRNYKKSISELSKNKKKKMRESNVTFYRGLLKSYYGINAFVSYNENVQKLNLSLNLLKKLE